MEFQKGDRVNINSATNHQTPGVTNPVIGSEYECEGTVRRVGTLTGIDVDWDNGLTCVYLSSQLSIVDDHVISIW